MTVPPPPSHRPQPRRRSDAEPEESLTTQLFIGQPKPDAAAGDDAAGETAAPAGAGGQNPPAGPGGQGMPAAATPNAGGGAHGPATGGAAGGPGFGGTGADGRGSEDSAAGGGDRAAAPAVDAAAAGQVAPDEDGVESTKMLSLDELREIAAETRDERIDGTREEDRPREQLPKPTKADEAFAEQQAAPSVWPGATAGGAASGPAQPPIVSPAAPQAHGGQPAPPAAPPVASPPPGVAPSPIPAPTPGAYPQAAGSNPNQPGAYPNQAGAYPQTAGVYPQTGGAVAQGAYPQQAGAYPPPAAGFGAPPPHPPQPPQQQQKKRGGLPASAAIILALAVLVVLGSVGYIVWDLSTRSDDVQGQTPAPPPPATDSQTPEPSASESSGEKVAESFSSPSGNISCTISDERARCQISGFDYTPPADKPKDCAVQPWGSVVVANKDGAGFSCSEAPPGAGGGRTLDYGQSVEAHGMRCTSHKDGMECRSSASGKGFKIARKAVSFPG